MDETLGQEGKQIPDGPNTQGRDEVKWKLPDGTEVTYEQHPYDEWLQIIIPNHITM